MAEEADLNPAQCQFESDREDMKKVYGPYQRKDGRRHVIHYDTETQERRTQSYSRFLMEQATGVTVPVELHIDHINDDPTDDRLNNYQLLTPEDNARKTRKPPVMYGFHCPVCGVWTEKLASQVRHNKAIGKAGPYCSRRCAGIAHH